MGRQNFIYARCIKFSKVTLSAERCLSAENMTPAQPWLENSADGAAGVESAGEAAATAAVDEDDTEGKETGAAGGESAGEAAVAEI